MHARWMIIFVDIYIYKFVVIFNSIYGMNINNVYTVYINAHLHYSNYTLVHCHLLVY